MTFYYYTIRKPQYEHTHDPEVRHLCTLNLTNDLYPMPTAHQYFLDTFGRKPSHVSHAPGRINLIGEHTDYNDGLVMPGAIDRYVTMYIAANDSSLLRVHATDLKESAEWKLHDADKSEQGWVNHLKGIISQCVAQGHDIRGIDIVISSTVPVGSGMSSSSALECAMILAINAVNHLELDPWKMIHMLHRSNHEFLGVHGGIMDQTASLLGQLDSLLLLDCRSLESEYIKADFAPYEMVVINTNVQHDNASGQYNQRPAECASALSLLQVSHPHVKSLRDASLDMVSELRTHGHDLLANRVQYVIEENQRVRDARRAIAERDYGALGQLLYRSHGGLQELYEVSCPELDVLVSLSQQEIDVAGARMMGAGHGGCTINLIHRDYKEEVILRICESYKATTGISATPYYLRLSRGAWVEMVS